MYKDDFLFIKKQIKKASNIFIMGHKYIDLDAFGASLGFYCYASLNKKNAYIIIDDKKLEKSVQTNIDYYKNRINIIKSLSAKEMIDNKSLLIIVDTNKRSLLQNSDILELFANIIVIDHHSIGTDSIGEERAIIINDVEASSTCEMLVSMLNNDNYLLPSDVATTVLAGIVLDTNNFVIRTDENTYYAAYYLAKCGADSREVQYLFKEDIKEYIEMQKVITEVKIIKKIAISKGLQTKMYRREELAKIADTILLFKNIEASFVIGKTDSGIGISARSMGNVNIGEVMEEFGGGGDCHEAATLIKDASLNDVVEKVVKRAKKM